MKRTIERLLRLVAPPARIVTLLFTAFAAGVAVAAVPTVAWDGDFGTTTKTGTDGQTYTFTLNPSGNSGENINTLVDGNVVIGTGSTYGGKINWSANASSSQKVSVLIKYSSLDTTDKGTPVLGCVTADQIKNGSTSAIIDDCVGVQTANGTKLTGRWNNNTSEWGGGVADIKTPSGYMLMVYQSGSAFQFWTSSDGVTWSGGTATSLLFGDTYPSGVGLGGMSGRASNSGYGSVSGMKIEGVAIYRGVALTTNLVRPPSSFDSEYVDSNNKKWKYANATFTWHSTTGTDIGSSTGTRVSLFSLPKDADTSVSFACGGNTTWTGANFWEGFCLGKGTYTAPGYALRVTSDHTNNSITGGFSPLTLGGLIIESGASNVTFSDNSSRATILGAASGDYETWFGIYDSISITRSGYFKFSGNVNLEIAKGKTLTISGITDTPTVVKSVTTANGASTDGGTLRFHGLGTLVSSVSATNEATLDFSDVQEDEAVVRSTTPFIQGNLAVDATTKFKFPSVGGAASYRLATALTADVSIPSTTFTIGDNEYTAPLTLTASSGTVEFPAVATLAQNNLATPILWDSIGWDAKPGTIGSSTPVAINVTDDTYLAASTALNLDSLVFNISPGKTLIFVPLQGLTVANGMTVKGGGALKLGQATVINGNVSFEDDTTLSYYDASTSLTVNGTLTVASGKTLTLAPASLSAAQATLASATSISGAVALSSPEDADNEYEIAQGSTAIVLKRIPIGKFSYDGTLSGVPTGWGSGGWTSDATITNLRVGPDAERPYVLEVTSTTYPGRAVTIGGSGSFTFAVYADLSKMVIDNSEKNYTIASVGHGSGGFVVLYCRDGKVMLGNFSGVDWTISPASVTKPAGSGYHLYTCVCDSSGSLALYCDTGTGEGETGTSSSGTLTVASNNRGLQLGQIWGGNSSFLTGAGLAVASVAGFDTALAAGEVANLATYSYPATDGTAISRDIQPNAAGKTLTVYSSSESGSATVLGPEAGTIAIPAGETVVVSKVRTYPDNKSTDANAINIAGKLVVTGSDTKTGTAGDCSVTIGYYQTNTSGTRTSTVSVPTGGELDASNAYIQMPWARQMQSAALNISGGTVKTKGLCSYNTAVGTVTLSDGGTLEVAEIISDDVAITKNFRYGTFRITADATETRAINFSAVSGYKTTLDPNGHTLTLAAAAVTGTGDITVATSADPKGKVVFRGTTGYTGTLFISDIDLVEFSPASAWTGNVKITSSCTLPANMSGFAGTLTIDGAITVDARGIDLSAATVVLSNGATLLADAGKEAKTGGITVNTGTTLKLYASNDVYNYEGHVFVGTPAGTLEYWRVENETDVQIIDANVLDGNNLLPYYQIWEVSGGTGSGVVNLAANWKGNAIPAVRTDGTYGNAAFHVTGGSDITVTVDATMPFGEIQVYGEGTVTFAASDANYLSADVLSISSGVTVKLAGGEPLKVNVGGFVQGGTKLEVASNASFALDGASCSTPLEVAGALTTKGATTLSSTANTVAGTMTVATGSTTLYAADRGLTGTLTIKTGASLLSLSKDFPDYNGSSTVNVYGTLSIGSSALGQRVVWTFKGSNALNLYAGALVNGYGSNTQGAIDMYDVPNHIISVAANPDDATLGIATVDAQIFLRENITLDVAEGVTLKMPVKPWHASGAKIFHKAGLGTLEICDDNTSSDAMNVLKGKVVSTVVPGFNVSISSGATFTLKDCAWTSGDKFSGEGTLELWTTGTSKPAHSVTRSTFNGILKTTSRFDTTGYQVNFNPSGNPNFASSARPELQMNAWTHLGDQYYRGTSSAGGKFAVRDLSGSGYISAEWSSGNYIYEVETMQTKDTVFNGAFLSSASSGNRVMNATVVGDGSGSVHTLTLGGASASADNAACKAAVLTVKDDAKVAFTSSGKWQYGKVVVADGGYVDVSANANAMGQLELQDGGTIILSTAAVPSVSALTLPASGIANIATFEGVALAADTPLLKVASGLSAGTIEGVFTVDGVSASLKAIETDGGVNVCFGSYYDDVWDTTEATDWTASAFDNGSYVDGMDVTFAPLANTVARSVAITGTVSPRNAVFKSGTEWTLTGGTFAPSGIVTLEAGANVAIESAATGSYVVGQGATLALSSATVTSVSGAGTLHIPAGATVTLATAGAIDGIASLTGEGNLVMPANTSPTAALQTLLQTASNWHGMVVITSLTGNAQRFVNNWGNTNSKIMLKGVQGYFPASTTVDAEVIFENGSNGYAYEILDSWTEGTIFRKISGSGLIKDTTTGKTSKHSHTFRDASGFTGSIEKTANRRFFFSAAKETGFPDVNGILYVDTDGLAKIGDGNFWKADVGGIRIAGTVEFLGAAMFSSAATLDNGATLTFDDIGTSEAPKKLTLNSAVTVASAHTVNIALSAKAAAALYDGAVLIDWTAAGAAPEGSFAFSDSALVDSWVLFKAATGLVVYDKTIDDTTQTQAAVLDVDDSGALVAVVTPTGNAITLPAVISKMTLSVSAKQLANITAPGVAVGDVVVKYGDTVTTGAYSITKDGDVISFDINTTADASVTIGNETIKVRPETAASTPMTMSAAGPSFTVKAIPGLWYQVLAADSVDGGALVSPVGGTAVQATTTTVSPAAPAFTGTVKFYKIAVGASEAALQ